MIYIGIDPGTPLTVAILDGNTLTFIEGEQLATQQKKGKTKRWVNNPPLLATALAAYDNALSPVRAVVETAATRPGQGAASQARYIASAGIAEGVLAGLDIPYVTVTPSKWKRDMKLTADKELSRARAIETFPGQADLFARKLDHNRAEAALLAVWLKQQE